MTEQISEFERTAGMTYSEAKQYLIQIGKWDEYKRLDGYSLVDTARYFRDKDSGNETNPE